MSDTKKDAQKSDTAKKAVKPRVSDVKLVEAYKVCKSSGELAKYVGLTVASVQTRINKLIKAGVKLTTYQRAKTSIDVAGLNALLPVQAVVPTAPSAAAPASK